MSDAELAYAAPRPSAGDHAGARHQGDRPGAPRKFLGSPGFRRAARAQHALRPASRPTPPRPRPLREACPRTRPPASPSLSRPTSRSPPPASWRHRPGRQPEPRHLPRPRQRRGRARAARATSSTPPRRRSRTCTSRTSPSPARTAGSASPTRGAPMGTGLHDYAHLARTVRPGERHQRDRRALAALAGRRRRRPSAPRGTGPAQLDYLRSN